MDRGRKTNRLTCEEQNALQLIKTNNLDDLYFPRSLVVARMHCEYRNLRIDGLYEKWNCIRLRSSQSKLARELMRNAEVTIPEERCGIREIEHFQGYLIAENIAIMAILVLSDAAKIRYMMITRYLPL